MGGDVRGGNAPAGRRRALPGRWAPPGPAGPRRRLHEHPRSRGDGGSHGERGGPSGGVPNTPCALYPVHGNPADMLQTWLWLPPDAGNLGARTETARDVLLPRAEVTAIWQHPGVVRDGRAPR